MTPAVKSVFIQGYMDSQLVRKDMDENDHDRISNLTLKTQMQLKEQCFCCYMAIIRDLRQ